MGWIQEARSERAQEAAGWSGVMSLPRILTMGAGGELNIAPIPELAMLRGAQYELSDVPLEPDSITPLPISGDTLEVIAEIEPGDAQQIALKLRCSPDGEEETVLRYDRASQRLLLDRSRSSLNPETVHSIQRGDFALAEGEPLRLHLFLDRSVIELFANHRTTLTSRIYPTRADSQQLVLLTHGGQARLRSLQVWEVK